MKRALSIMALALAAAAPICSGAAADDAVLRLRYALLTVEHGDEVPAADAARRADAVKDLRAAWGPTEQNTDVHQLLSLKGLEVRVTPPQALSRRQPAYTEAARRNRVQGTVTLGLLIDERGRVEEVEVLQGLPDGLGEAAATAAGGWRFAPALLAGKPVAVSFNTTVNFRLQ